MIDVKRWRDKNGSFYRYGKTGKKYYFKTEEDRKQAKRKAILNGYALEKKAKFRTAYLF